MFLFFCYGVHHQVTYMCVITTWCNLAILFLNTLCCVGKGFSNYLCIHYTQTEFLQQRPTLLEIISSHNTVTFIFIWTNPTGAIYLNNGQIDNLNWLYAVTFSIVYQINKTYHIYKNAYTIMRIGQYRNIKKSNRPSFPNTPSTEITKGTKFWRCSRQGWRYFSSSLSPVIVLH